MIDFDVFVDESDKIYVLVGIWSGVMFMIEDFNHTEEIAHNLPHPLAMV